MSDEVKDTAVTEFKKSLENSAVKRKAMEKRFGFIPKSIIRLGRGALSRGMFVLQQERRERGSVGTGMGVAKTEREQAIQSYMKENKILGRSLEKWAPRKEGQKGGNRMNASTMPAELVAFFIKYYAKPGDVYVDPFMGQGVQMQVAHHYRLHYYGYDISEEFFRYIAETKEKIDNGQTKLEITLGDSRFPDNVPDGIADFSFHSPPYWDIEYYGEEEEQLGTGHSYEEFLEGMEQVAKAWLPKFKPGAYHVVNVNDFRRQGVFYPYHADTIHLFMRAGWIYHDMWIVDGLVGGLPKAFAVDFNLKRVAPKTHEYCLVFRAPGGE